MTKTIIKEVGIFLLLLICIALILGIVFYDYIPSSKTVPIKKQAYTLPEDVQEELNKSVTAGQNIVKTFYLDSTDLDAYESSNEYDSGKANPFGDYTTNYNSGGTSNTNNNVSENTNSNNTQTQGNNNQENTNNQEVYFNTPGKNY